MWSSLLSVLNCIECKLKRLTLAFLFKSVVSGGERCKARALGLNCCECKPDREGLYARRLPRRCEESKAQDLTTVCGQAR